MKGGINILDYIGIGNCKLFKRVFVLCFGFLYDVMNDCFMVVFGGWGRVYDCLVVEIV